MCIFCFCDKEALTNKEIIKKIQKCENYGHKSILFRNGFSNTHIYEIQCSNERIDHKEKIDQKKGGYDIVCIYGYSYIKNKNGTYTQMFKKVRYVSGLGTSKGARSLPIECESDE